MAETRYAVARRVPGRDYAVLEGPVALTAAGAAEGYALKLREGVSVPLKLSRATRTAMARTRERLQARDRERDRARARERERAHALASWAAAQDW